MNNENKDTTETTNTENTNQDNHPKGSTDTDENIKSSLKDQNRNSGSESWLSFVGGIGAIIIINLLVLFLGVIFMAVAYYFSVAPHKVDYAAGFFLSLGYLFTLFIGLGQLLYAIPWVIKLKKSGEPVMANGIIAGAVITALLDGGCYINIITHI